LIAGVDERVLTRGRRSRLNRLWPDFIWFLAHIFLQEINATLPVFMHDKVSTNKGITIQPVRRVLIAAGKRIYRSGTCSPNLLAT
jgi:hypothetical protein